MTTHLLKRDRQSFSDNFKILLKHTSDALPLIEYQLSPFKDYRCNVEPWIEGETSGNTLSIYTKPIRDPLDSRKFSVSATVSIRDQYAYMKVPYDPHLTLLSHIDDLSGSIICDEFCSLHRTEFRRVFHALCDYHEGAKAIEDPLYMLWRSGQLSTPWDHAEQAVEFTRLLGCFSFFLLRVFRTDFFLDFQ